MRLSQALIVTSKELQTFRKKRNILYSTFIVPLIVSFLFPLVIRYDLQKSGTAALDLPYLLPAFFFFYFVLAGLIPSTIASYSIVGEKVEKSLEPLLATPTTDSEILLGKGIAAVIPPMAAILAGAAVFMGLTDAMTAGRLGYYFFPNWSAALVLFFMVPLGTVMSVEWSVMVSSRVNDIRVAQQISSLLIVPFAGIYVGGELNLIQLGDIGTLLVITGVLVLVDLVFLYVVRATFQREEILTKWK